MPGYELFDERERKEVAEVMETGVLMRYGFKDVRAGRWKAREMEEAIRKKAGVKHALLLADGTAALTTALAALGVGSGDEVIMPTFTFVASFESVMTAGATPILADVDDTLCLNPDAVVKVITPRTKVVMPVHMCGAAADVDALKEVCKSRGLFLVEDACQAFGASYKGKFLGGLGGAGCYSFDFNKIVTCGEGGAVVTDDDEFYKRADMYHDHGHDHGDDDRGAEGHPFPGYNYRISELHAAVGCAQIAKLDDFVARSRRSKKYFKDALAEIPDITFRRLPDSEGDCGTFLCFFMPDEARARAAARALKESGAEGVFHWYDNNWHYVRNWRHLKERRFANPVAPSLLASMPDYSKADFSASDRWMSRCISISIKLGWNDAEAAAKAQAAAKAVKSALQGGAPQYLSMKQEVLFKGTPRSCR
ncbi:MAG: aminotransferase class I/II-fold pyridoxal phosphate-dependent enzyme [Synergistaceae bacterium]|nr:aminotransferase class I/II-fold pyridoxal phosphate-dependent enzyme [Synergistaceae bacterium]